MSIIMRNVSWLRNEQPILKNVNWTVQPGENWAIVGLNGSGKTTLLNIINGYIWPTTGEVSVLGNRFGQIDLRELRKSIGWVSSSLQAKMYPAETALNVVLSGRFASIGLYDNPEEADYQRAEQLLEELGCAYLADRPIQTCSQGEQQKILIARALLSQPKLLILDEPCNGLDIFAREQLLATIEQLGQQADAPTMLYVTHHIEEILPTFSHTLLIREGEIFATGRSTEVLSSDQLSKFFATLVDVQWRHHRPWLQLT